MPHADKSLGHISSHIGLNDINILIADDDPSMLLLLKHVLEDEGYIVSQAHSGREAIELCTQTTFDLAILDIVMPDINGFEACRSICSFIEDSPSILLITSLDDDISVNEAFNCGANEYITKPINWSVFKHRVRRLLENRRSQETIRQLTHHHPLTGLPNRVLMLDRLESALHRAQRSDSFLALIMIDIDNFKLINETLGHETGDQLLQSVANRLEHTVRETDTLAHIGGDEFCMIIENIHRLDDIAVITDSLSHTLEHDIKLANHNIHIKASMGVTVYPQDGEDIITLLSNADIALYRAKERGNNLYQFFSPDLSKQAYDRLSIENNLRQAILSEQLIIYYQPKYSFHSLQIDSMEALVRWQHPDRGLMHPDEFIPVAEETGLIVPLGEWVIKTACRQFSEWRDQGLEVDHISINVSARQFKQQDLVSIFEEVMDETGLNPHFIEIEITESTLLNHDDAVETKLNTLHNMGIHIAIDDFGTGYASLSYLKQLPIDTLKIDCSFIDGIINDADDRAIVNAIVSLAKALGMQLVAEGIESRQQLEKLLELKVDYGQGYFWSPAVDAQSFSGLLEKLNRT